jgi:pimeloyl-ACP methyl ester carboxylesterase
MQDGLAIYTFGAGEPLLLMPYPHAGAVVGEPPMTDLMAGLADLGRRVLTFDPPQSGRSTRPMHLGMEEMLGCAVETLGAYGMEGAVDVLGHSQGGFAALALAIERPELVRRLVLVGTGAGGPSWIQAPGSIWNPSHPDHRRFALWASIYWLSRRLAAQEHMLAGIRHASYLDRTRFPPS